MRGNWWGMLGEHYARAYGRLGAAKSCPASRARRTDHHARALCDDRGIHRGLPHAFAAAGRVLLPPPQGRRRDRHNATCSAVAGGGARGLYANVPFDDVLYSLATSHPGALVLHNYPSGLRKLPKKPRGLYLDIASIDVLRDRERGVPRYCAFRRHARHERAEDLRAS